MGRKFSSLSDPEFSRLFTDFRYTAFRLESLQTYDVSYERDQFDRFLSGEPRGPFPGIERWADSVRRGTRLGKRFHRVHVLVEPLSDYARFECAWAYRQTVAAGEDVRVIPVSGDDWPEGLPRLDYWLFDSTRLALMNYAADGTFESAELVDDPARIVQANHWRDLAISKSMSFQEYAQRFDSLMHERVSRIG